MDIQYHLTADEDILSRINEIKDAATSYGIWDAIENCITINYSEDKSKLGYDLTASKVIFNDFSEFQMKLKEKAISEVTSLITNIQSYSYHGQHQNNPSVNFISFDYEPFKIKYAPLHINANPKMWGDHLTYPDGTNLDISKMNFSKALSIFYRYANDVQDFPTDITKNQPYVDMIEGGYK